MSWPVGAAAALVAALLGGLAALGGCDAGATTPAGAREVVLYTSVDEEVARPVIARFEAAAPGTRVSAVFDVEATKTTGLVSRILAERAAPRADVFWSSEELRTEVLKRAGALEPYRSPAASDIPEAWKDPDGCYTGFAARARVIAWNTKRLTAEEAPKRLEDLLAPRFRGEVAVANPLFGTTGAEAAVLFAEDAARARDFYTRLLANGAQVVDGNSVVRDRVASGAVLCGLTDTDDAFEAMAAGMPLACALGGLGGEGAVVIPNTVALVRGAPHAVAARALIDFLVSAGTERQLATLARQMPLRPALSDLAAAAGVGTPRKRIAPAVAFAALEPSQAFFREALNR